MTLIDQLKIWLAADEWFKSACVTLLGLGAAKRNSAKFPEELMSLFLLKVKYEQSHSLHILWNFDWDKWDFHCIWQA